MQIEQNTILVPLMVGLITIVLTIGIHTLALATVVHLIRHERRLGRAGSSFSMNMMIVTAGILIALGAHFAEVLLWAGIFEAAEFPAFATALYRSALDYTTLGDVAMSPRWRLLGPLAATDGMLMFGISTAMIFAVIQGLVQRSFPDLRD